MKYSLPQPVSILRGATLTDGSVVDVELSRDGDHTVVAAVRPAAEVCDSTTPASSTSGATS